MKAAAPALEAAGGPMAAVEKTTQTRTAVGLPWLSRPRVPAARRRVPAGTSAGPAGPARWFSPCRWFSPRR